MIEQQNGEIVIRRDANTAAEEAHFEACYAEVEVALHDLQTLFEMENRLLQGGRRRELADHQGRKEDLTAAFRTLMGRLLETPQFLQGEANTRRRELGERIKGLQRLMGDNRVLLNAAKVATFRRIEAAVEARRQQMEANLPYGSNGTRDRNVPPPIPSAVSTRKI